MRMRAVLVSPNSVRNRRRRMNDLRCTGLVRFASSILNQHNARITRQYSKESPARARCADTPCALVLNRQHGTDVVAAEEHDRAANPDHQHPDDLNGAWDF